MSASDVPVPILVLLRQPNATTTSPFKSGIAARHSTWTQSIDDLLSIDSMGQYHEVHAHIRHFQVFCQKSVRTKIYHLHLAICSVLSDCAFTGRVCKSHSSFCCAFIFLWNEANYSRTSPILSMTAGSSSFGTINGAKPRHRASRLELHRLWPNRLNVFLTLFAKQNFTIVAFRCRPSFPLAESMVKSNNFVAGYFGQLSQKHPLN